MLNIIQKIPETVFYIKKVNESLLSVSHIQRIGYQPEKVRNTVANPARGLLSRGKIKKTKKSGSASPSPPLRCSFGENTNQNHETHLHT